MSFVGYSRNLRKAICTNCGYEGYNSDFEDFSDALNKANIIAKKGNIINHDDLKNIVCPKCKSINSMKILK